MNGVVTKKTTLRSDKKQSIARYTAKAHKAEWSKTKRERESRSVVTTSVSEEEVGNDK